MFSRQFLVRLFASILPLAVAGRIGAAYTALQTALDDGGLNFTSSSAAVSGTPPGPWVNHTNAADCLDDTDGMRAPAMTKAGDSWIEANVTGPDVIDFQWSLQTSAPNALTCLVDGTVRITCPPSAPARWYYASVNIPSGLHTVRWNYKQTGVAGSKALLDQVSQAGDNWASLQESPYVQLLAGEPAFHRFATKQPALMWEVYWDSLPPGLTLDSQTGIISGVPAEPGIWRPLIRITSASYGLYYRIQFEVLDKPTLLSALDGRSLVFTTSASDGSSVWTPQSHGSRDDLDCIVAGLPPPASRTAPFTPGWSSLETVTSGPDVLSYWVRVANGRVTLLLDGKEYRAHGPSQALPLWRRTWLTIPQGQHTVAWKYEPYSDAAPTAWLDEIHLSSEVGAFIESQPLIGPQPSGEFDYPIPFSGSAGSWTATNLPGGLSVNSGSGSISGTPTMRGVWQTRLTLTGAAGDHDDAFALIDTSIPVAEALNLPNSWWNTGPESGAYWFGQNAVSHDGTGAVRSPPVPSGGSSTLTTTLKSPGTLRWWWHIPAGSAGDFCALAIDGGKAQVTLSAPSPWKEESIALPEGLHEVSWRWVTDADGDPFSEAVIIDQVSPGP
jgi:hypothetical protein